MIELLSIYSDDQKIAMIVCLITVIALLLINTRIGPTNARSIHDEHGTPAQPVEPVFDIDPAAFWRKD